MNITCDQCGKRYKMKAQQTKKAFKTRCKRCSNVIIVRPEEQKDAVVQEPVQANHQPSPEVSAPSWYAVINGEQSGPYTTDQLGGYVANGSLDAQSFVWCDGMSNWEALENIPVLVNLISLQSTPRPVTSAQNPQSVPVETNVDPKGYDQKITPAPNEKQSLADAPQPQVHDPNAALSLGVQIGHSRELLSQVKAEQSSSDQGVMSATQSPMGYSPSQAQSLSDENMGQLTNQRNENSVLFSLDSIDAAGSIGIKNEMPRQSLPNKQAAVQPSLTNTGGSDGSGLIDLAALSSLTGNGGGRTGGAPINLSVGMKKVGGSRSLTNRSTDIKSLALAISSTALVVVLGVLGYQKFIVTPVTKVAPITLGKAVTSTPPPENTTSMVASTVGKPKDTSALTVDTVGAMPAEQTVEKVKQESSKNNIRRPTRVKKRNGRSSKKGSSRSRKSRSKKSRSSSDRRRSRTTSSPKKTEASALLTNLKGGKSRSRKSSSISSITGSSKPKASGPKKPSKRSIVSTMRKVNLGSCLSRDPGLKGKGKIKVRIVAVSSGAIKTAKVLNAPFKSSPVGACLEREVRRQRFPSFTDRDISFTFPFKN
jgi:hypothetical protein